VTAAASKAGAAMGQGTISTPTPVDLRLSDADLLKPPGSALKPLAGSDDPRFNNVLLNAVAQTLWLPSGVEDEHCADFIGAALAAVRGFNPRDEAEGMMAAQAVALHHAAMECFRRAMLPGQTPEVADKLRRQGANLARAMVDMAEAIDRRRGKGLQIVRVERVVVHDGGQAIVGAVVPPVTAAKRGGGGDA
jgi:hypothetical protein